MIHIKKITYDDILPMWTKYMPNMSLEPTSAMSCFLIHVKNEKTYKFEFIDHYDLENQKFTPTFWGAFDNEKLIGVNSGHMTLDRMYRSRGLYVNKDYRGRGIGQKLLMKTTSQGYHENAIAIWSYPKHDSWSTYGYVGFRQSGHTFNFEWEQSGESFNTKSVVVLDEEALYQLDTPQHQTP